MKTQPDAQTKTTNPQSNAAWELPFPRSVPVVGSGIPEPQALVQEYGPLPEGGHFIDLGSGTGKQVASASVLHPWKKCVGIEILEKLDGIAQKNLEKFKEAREGFPEPVPKSPEVACVRANFLEEVPNHFGETFSVFLAVATCYGTKLMTELCETIKGATLNSFLITVTRPKKFFKKPDILAGLRVP